MQNGRVSIYSDGVALLLFEGGSGFHVEVPVSYVRTFYLKILCYECVVDVLYGR